MTASVVTLLTLLCYSMPRGVAAEGSGLSAIKGLVDGIAKPLKEKNHIPGIAIAVTLEGTSYFFKYGIASQKDGKPATNETLLEVGSLRKTPAAMLASYAEIKGAQPTTTGPLTRMPLHGASSTLIFL